MSGNNESVMQNFVDSFCQCFGTTAAPGGNRMREMKRHTRSLSLKEKAARDPMFFDGQAHHRRGVSLEQAPMLSKTKSTTTKKKRARSRSKDDIFRNKKASQDETPFSRFLSNHPVVMRSLCFATPIRDSEDELEEAASVVSESNTLNTAEDTITSTVYYERTKLAGLEQKTPPMPLFHSQSVKDVAQLNTARSRSSQTPPPPVMHVSSDDSSSTKAL